MRQVARGSARLPQGGSIPEPPGPFQPGQAPGVVKGRNHFPQALLRLKYVFASLTVSKAPCLKVVLVCSPTAGSL